MNTRLIKDKYIRSVKADRGLDLYVYTFRQDHQDRCQIVWATSRSSADSMMRAKYGEEKKWIGYPHQKWLEFEYLMKRYNQPLPKPVPGMLFEDKEERK